MGSEKLPAVVNHIRGHTTKQIWLTTFYIIKIDNSSCCMYIFDPADSVLFPEDL